MDTIIYNLQIDKRVFYIDFIDYLDICCASLQPKQEVDKSSNDLNIQTEKTKGVYSMPDMLNYSYSIEPLQKYIKEHYGLTLYENEDNLSKEQLQDKNILIAYSFADNCKFIEVHKAFILEFLTWVGDKFYFDEYKAIKASQGK